ncbi:GGDEF domain-containing protein [Streptomyces sp. NPDC005302]|uniref:GGDEF domain-containing protein n=1 Tax=Streptomyces sp. NPDC005302 TaxID=3154675 RepID=UPI0033B1E470
MSQSLAALAAALPLASGWSIHSLWMRRRIEAARRDPLTGLWTRDAFEERARNSLAHGSHRAVLVLDLNWFKEINDTHGHAAGDAVIRATGRRLGAWAAGYRGVAGRLGGDEFAAVIEVSGEVDVHHANVNARVLELIGSLERPVPFEDCDIDVHVSVGVVRHWHCAPELSTLLRLADEHMYRIKREGGGASIAPAHEIAPTLATVHGRRIGRRGTTGKEAS